MPPGLMVIEYILIGIQGVFKVKVIYFDNYAADLIAANAISCVFKTGAAEPWPAEALLGVLAVFLRDSCRLLSI
jgi:hypothetical protein